VREAFAKYLGIKNPRVVSGNKVAVPVMYCPVALNTGVIAATGTFYNGPENFLDDGTLSGGSGQQGGKFLYSWVANPWTQNSVAAAGGDPDLAAAAYYWHQDTDPPTADVNNPGGNVGARACKPGLEYLRRLGDKNATNVAICVDSSRQQTAGWFWMHGNGSTRTGRGWKNELFGDGHVDAVRPDQCKTRWGPNNAGNGNGPTGW
jgi:hypothetical protein